MRLATVVEKGGLSTAIVSGERYLSLGDEPAFASMLEIIAGGAPVLRAIQAMVAGTPAESWPYLADAQLGPAVPGPGAVYTVGSNYRMPGETLRDRPERPPIYAKAPTSVTGPGATLTWDRGLTANVDGECELGVVLGPGGSVFGYTVVNDISSRDPWLEGDQWLLGKSMPGFCPVGPWIVSADALSPAALPLGCRINGQPIQDGTTADMWFGVDQVIAYLRRHLMLRPGDLIAMGTPARLAAPPGPDRHLEPGDRVTVWIDQIGELDTNIA